MLIDGMEKLKAYLAGRRKSEFAKEIGTSPAYLSQLLSGHRRPSYDLMLKISQATSGCVDLNSWASSSEAN